MKRTTSINWLDGAPRSNEFDDIYFSIENGLHESNHVFLEGNDLPNRWQSRVNDFHIIETGFGTGLNFFASCKLWQELDSSAHLYYTSIERYPLNISDIIRTINLWPEIAAHLNEFKRQYPEFPYKESKIKLANIRVHLKIIWYDINKALPLIQKAADAWFLDGFSPAKNPEMWNSNLFQHMAKLTNKHGTCATFTASGNIRRGLQKSGFHIQKVPGYGKKRHILVGYKQDKTTI